ncbi:hypothetical protein [Pseudonocardia sp. HH130630-07]|uniref:hypothetical protein n=1 Tax=Pseudonocardia sp. HH130630-07 TaxID=1690815 RepID=UPI000814BD94|nr:hypothetical protein [Pseudonocardia sp. HH130630-07]ANY06231.1 hypothetical protein AFB00_07880 [Pseudonocardia sp. HH130630-07]
MGLLDKIKERLTGGGQAAAPQQPAGVGGAPQHLQQQPPQDPDQQAVERYRYMLRTAPPEQVEQAHAEAFAKLTPEQRQKVLTDVGSAVPESERATSTDPQALARMATRAEMREPGTMERSLGGGRGPGMGGMIAGSLLAGVAGAFIGTAIAGAMFDDPGADAAGEDVAAGEEPPAEDPGLDDGGGDFDMGGDFDF